MQRLFFVLILSLSGCLYSIDGSLLDPDQGAGDASCDGDCVEKSLGRVCSDNVLCPKLMGMDCVTPGGGDNGYCSLSCEVAQGSCDGGPVGAEFGCVLETKGELFCIFICARGDDVIACPFDLKCAPEEMPAGSGQRVCVVAQ